MRTAGGGAGRGARRRQNSRISSSGVRSIFHRWRPTGYQDAPPSPGFTANVLVSVAEPSQAPRTPRKNKYLNILRHSKQPRLKLDQSILPLVDAKMPKECGSWRAFACPGMPPPPRPCPPSALSADTESAPELPPLPSTTLLPHRREPAATSGDDVTASSGGGL